MYVLHFRMNIRLFHWGMKININLYFDLHSDPATRNPCYLFPIPHCPGSAASTMLPSAAEVRDEETTRQSRVDVPQLT